MDQIADLIPDGFAINAKILRKPFCFSDLRKRNFRGFRRKRGRADWSRLGLSVWLPEYFAFIEM